MEVLIALTTTTEVRYDDEHESKGPHRDALHARLQRSSEEHETHDEEDVLFVSEVESHNETLDCKENNGNGNICFSITGK